MRQEKAYPEIRKFERWMEAGLLKCPPKSLMEGAISYTYKIIKKLSLYVTDGRYKIDDNMDERTRIEDVLRRIPEYELGKKDFSDLLPGNRTPQAR